MAALEEDTWFPGTAACCWVVAMELAHSLLLNEDALAQITEAKRPVFIFEWLRFLDKVLLAANKVNIQVYLSKYLEQGFWAFSAFSEFQLS